MRIRSIKPEFWTSKTMAKFSWEDRLLLKALESYVDDNGVGKDDIELIVTSLFPRDYFQHPLETVARVSEGISRLSQGFLVTRYDAEAESLLYIERWKEKQRVDKPQKGRYPRPDGSFEYNEAVDKSKYQGIREGFQNIPETVAPVTGEQGNRGTGEQSLSCPAADADEAPVIEEQFELAEVPMREPSIGECFAKFWTAYPRKDDRKKALEKFEAALKRASAEEIIAGAERYRDDPNRDPGYTKLPTTWLNADAWENGPLPPRSNGKPSLRERKDAEGGQVAAEWLASRMPSMESREIER